MQQKQSKLIVVEHNNVKANYLSCNLTAQHDMFSFGITKTEFDALPRDILQS